MLPFMAHILQLHSLMSMRSGVCMIDNCTLPQWQPPLWRTCSPILQSMDVRVLRRKKEALCFEGNTKLQEW
jgi:hypothetical protein